MYRHRTTLPRTLTEAELSALLNISAESAAGRRDHMLFAVTLGTGLRAFELVALDVGQALNERGAGRERIELLTFKRCTEYPAPQVVSVPDALRHKLSHFGRWKRRRGESLDPGAPLFVARGGRRLSKRGLQKAWDRWSDRAELAASLTFHSLRHTYGQNLYDRTGDIEVVRAAMRHADVQSTSVYAHASAARVAAAVRELPC